MDTETTTDPRVLALATFLDCDTDELTECSYDDAIIESGHQQYLVVDDDEAKKRASDTMRDELAWAFSARFIADHAPDSITAAHIESMKGNILISNGDCSDAMVALIEAGKGWAEFVDGAISEDGMAHFLATYDGEESESADGEYLIYRVN